MGMEYYLIMSIPYQYHIDTAALVVALTPPKPSVTQDETVLHCCQLRLKFYCLTDKLTSVATEV